MGSSDKRQKDAPTRLRRGERLQVQVSAEAAEKVIAAAIKQRRPVSQMLRVIVEEWADAQTE